MSYPLRVQFDRRGRGEGAGRVGRSGPGGKEWAGWEGVGRGQRSRPGGKASAGGKGVGLGGGKESAGADWVVVRYISLLPRFFIRFFKARSGDRTLPLNGSSSIIYYSETIWQFIPGD